MKENKVDSSLDYIKILKALMELPFQVGKGLLSDFLNGNYSNKSIIKNRLDELDNFDTLSWSKDKIYHEIDKLTANGMINLATSDYNKFIKILELTIKGRNEINNPTLLEKKLANKIDFKKTEITETDREIFKALDSFLGNFNDEQKKAIISGSKNLLCVAGAGSGKTTVLTKRIEFLVKYKSVDPSKILAITFTKKAREEMEKRLYALGVNSVRVHTFNSFCEGILRNHETEIYGRPIRVQSYGDKILAMNMALGNMGLDMQDAINDYFTVAQRKFKTGSQLSNSFMNDCFSVMDYFKVTGETEYNWSKDADAKNKNNAERIFKITKYLKEHMMIQGLRDYTDQLIDAIKFLKSSPENIPQFDYVLVDEYQDVNAMQIELIGLLNPGNLFAVGDPRQSIFGWRGSDINYILKFEETYGECEVVHLTKNYRSSKEIVEFMNHSITEMGLPDIQASLGVRGEGSEVRGQENARIKILDFGSEESERAFVIKNIIDNDTPNSEIFVLARTNRQLMELSRLMKMRGISHVVKTDEVKNPKDMKEGDVTLATIHAIKGLEAKKVFVIGSNEQNFPCKASDHPAIEMVKTDNYDKEEEERRLFYVAISRAKEILYVTYSGKKPTYFLNDEMMGIGSDKISSFSKAKPKGAEKIFDEDLDDDLIGELKSWRLTVAEEQNVPAYVVLTNKTIDDIARKMPKDAIELSGVSGIGPNKLVNYGNRILEIVREITLKSD
ncbi:ATP-dependent DNA helicase UvrD2 [Candidatus Pacearchaeota archaeon]|nr:ATP-dependent DNA helicase UvrD2 [Candidatus Pacearchaeota archaeon]